MNVLRHERTNTNKAQAANKLEKIKIDLASSQIIWKAAF